MKYPYAHRMQYVNHSAVRELLKLGSDPGIISFGGGFPDPEIFPIDQLRAVFDDVLLRDGKAALQYATTEGLPALRQKIITRMQREGLQLNLDNVFLVQGAQQGLDLAAKMFIDPGDTVITENPTFMGALIAFNPYEPRYVGIPMDAEGLITDSLEDALKTNPKVKFIYTVPDFQNPTGITMSLARRQRLMARANEYDVVIIEGSP
jgi:2-aminoadipate transaminase